MVRCQGNEGTVLTSERSIGWSHAGHKRVTATLKLLTTWKNTPLPPPSSLPPLSTRPPLYGIPAAVGTLPHWLTGLVLKLSPLPPENWEGGTA